MAAKSQVRVEYNLASVSGKSEFDQKQLENLQYAGIVRLKQGLIYVPIRQWVHDEDLLRPINGVNKSKKVFILGINEATNAIETALTLAINGLSQQFYATTEEEPNLRITAVQNAENLWRAISGTTQTSVWTKGGLPIRIEGNNAYIPYDIAFKLVKRESVYIGQFQKKKGKWDMLTKTEDGKTYLDLAVVSMNRYEEVPVPEYDLKSLPAEVRKQIETYQKDLPA